MHTVALIPPEIIQYYDRRLLTGACPDFKDTPKMLKRILSYVLTLERKLKTPRRYEKFRAKLEEYLEIYGRIQEKEDELKGKAEKKAQMPFYYITMPDRSSQNLFSRLRRRSSVYA